MKFFDLVDISERYMELVNPSTPEKILTIGKFLELKKDSRVIDFGCGYGEVLILWAEHFGISGIGLEIREQVCDRAKKKITERGYANSIEIICMNAAEYSYEKNSFDVAACIGASFIWGGYTPTIDGMRDAVCQDGKLVIGEPYWLKEHVPTEYAKEEQGIHTEFELLQLARNEGYDFEYMVRASHDDWDRYESDNWYGLIKWIKENHDHPERQEVISHLH